jgi:hypothetical protein
MEQSIEVCETKPPGYACHASSARPLSGFVNRLYLLDGMGFNAVVCLREFEAQSWQAGGSDDANERNEANCQNVRVL